MFNTPGNTTPSVPSVVIEFWASLKLTSYTAACPRCNAQNLEVRSAGRGRHTEFYTFCCNTVSRVFTGESQMSRVVRQLAEDARLNAPRPDQTEHNPTREADDALTTAIQDAEADARALQALEAEETDYTWLGIEARL